MIKPSDPCHCHSNKKYIDCCGPYHLKKITENAYVLMRSRYSAYALGLYSYIIETTAINGKMRF